jgi:hypothetical protein
MDSLKFYPGLPCPTLLCPAGGLLLKRPYVGPAWSVVGLRLSSTPLNTLRHTPVVHSASTTLPQISGVKSCTGGRIEELFVFVAFV